MHTKRILLLAILFLGVVAVAPFGIAHASPVSTSLPGVKPGDNATYVVTSSWKTDNATAFPAPAGLVMTNLDYAALRITAVSGANVTFTVTFYFLNGTVVPVETENLDVQTQNFCYTSPNFAGTQCNLQGSQSPVLLLAGGLQAPDAIGQDPSVTLNQTGTRTILGAQRTVNMQNITQFSQCTGVQGSPVCATARGVSGDAWDQASGIVVGAETSVTFTSTVGSATGSISIALRSTNIWTTFSPNFSLSSNPSSVTLKGGKSGSSTVTLISINGFRGTVNLQVSSSPLGLSCTLSATSATLSSSGSSSLTVSCNGSKGSYTVTVTGTAGSLSHSTTVAYTILHGHRGQHP